MTPLKENFLSTRGEYVFPIKFAGHFDFVHFYWLYCSPKLFEGGPNLVLTE